MRKDAINAIIKHLTYMNVHASQKIFCVGNVLETLDIVHHVVEIMTNTIQNIQLEMT